MQDRQSSPIRSSLAAAILTFPLLACRDQSPTEPGAFLQGVWGGDQVSLSISGNGGSLKAFCAEGTIDQAIAPDPTGRFDVTGSVALQQGPTRMYSAHYSGWTDGRTMTLTVAVPDAQQTLGPFTLLYSRQTNVDPCPIS